jgi:type II restriction/modification system DNA methylase subunit YeeA
MPMLNPESITILDPACGSGHILVEAYDLLKDIYLEAGYRLRDIPRLILEKNLYGLDIDERAAQMAGFALLMKARADDRRILENPPRLNVLAIRDSRGLDVGELAEHLQPFGIGREALAQLVETFAEAKTFGSLIQIPASLDAALPGMVEGLRKAAESGDVFAQPMAEELIPLVWQAGILGMKFDAVVANPPYMGSKYFNPPLKSFLKQKYEKYDKDLFSSFINKALYNARQNGFVGIVSSFTWMFISSFEGMRNDIIEANTISSLIQLEYDAFEDAKAHLCTFVFLKQHIQKYEAGFVRLTDFRGAENQGPRTIEAIKNPECGWYYTAKPDEFKKIPGSPVAYWISDKLRDVFLSGSSVGSLVDIRQGLATADNDRFLRIWHETSFSKIGLGLANREDAKNSNKKWFPHSKGGYFRKWYGNREWVVNWERDGEEIRGFIDEN